MNIFKKIIGYILFLLAIILSVVTLFVFLKCILDSIKEFDESTATGIGFIVGTLIMITIFVLISIFVFKTGLRLIRNNVSVDSIDEIGKAEL